MSKIFKKIIGLFFHKEVIDSYEKSGIHGSINAAQKIRARRLKNIMNLLKIFKNLALFK